MTSTAQADTSTTPTPTKRGRKKDYCKSQREKLNSCNKWAQAKRRGLCVSCYDVVWADILDQRVAGATPPTLVALQNHETPSPEGEVTDVLDQTVAEATPPALVALWNHKTPSPEGQVNERITINLINAASHESDNRIRNLKQLVRQIDEEIDNMKNELVMVQQKLATFQKDFNIAELFRENDDVDFECTGDSGGGTLNNNDGENYPTLGQGVSQDNSDNGDDNDNDDPVINDEKEDNEKHNKDGEYNNELQNSNFH